jgi:hypothetical protein
MKFGVHFILRSCGHKVNALKLISHSSSDELLLYFFNNFLLILSSILSVPFLIGSIKYSRQAFIEKQRIKKFGIYTRIVNLTPLGFFFSYMTKKRALLQFAFFILYFFYSRADCTTRPRLKDMTPSGAFQLSLTRFYIVHIDLVTSFLDCIELPPIKVSYKKLYPLETLILIHDFC